MVSSIFSIRTYNSAAVLAIKAVCIIGINRWVARHLGPSGLTEYVHFLNALSLFLLIPSEGIGKAIVKYLSDSSFAEKERAIAAGWLLNIAAALASLVVLLLAPKYFLGKAFPLLSTGDSFPVLILIVALVIYGHLVLLYLQSVLLGRDQFLLYVIFQVTAAVLPLAFLLVGDQYSQEYMVLALGSVAAILVLPAHFFLIRWSGWQHLRGAFNYIFSSGSFLKWLLVAAVSVIAGKGVEFFMRSHSIELYGNDHTGLWQSVAKFSDYYMSVFYGLSAMVFFPKLSAMVTETLVFKRVFTRTVGTVLMLTVLGLLLIYVFKFYILLYFFDQQFLDAEQYFAWQLIADLFRVLTALCGMALLVRERLYAYMWVQLSYGFTALLWVLLPAYQGGMQFIHAGAVAAIVAGLLNLWLVRKEFTI